MDARKQMETTAQPPTNIIKDKEKDVYCDVFGDFDCGDCECDCDGD